MSRPIPWRMAAFALVVSLAGCSEFAQRRLAGPRDVDPLAEAPKPSPALQISNAPGARPKQSDDQIQKASFLPDRQAPPNPQMQQQPLRILYQRAAQTYAGMDSYIYRLRRREAVDGKKMPEELIRVALRRDPYSVHLKWLGNEGKGRETIFVKGKFNDEMQVLLASGDAWPLPAGFRWSISPTDKKAQARSRYPITETGFGSLVERYGVIVANIEKGDPRDGTMKYLGRVKRPEFETKVEAVHQQGIPPNSDRRLPKGGQRWWFFDAAHGLPVLVVTHDPDGEVEYYCHDHIQWPVRLDDDDFNPDRLWRK
jgi:uncharacterized protein DUF1571